MTISIDIMENRNKKIIDWLMNSDPAIRWQIMSDLLNTQITEILIERKKIETQGWGAKLLSFQDGDGKWSNEIYNKKWISTVYTLQLLKEYGILPENKKINKALE